MVKHKEVTGKGNIIMIYIFSVNDISANFINKFNKLFCYEYFSSEQNEGNIEREREKERGEIERREEEKREKERREKRNDNNRQNNLARLLEQEERNTEKRKEYERRENNKD
ncbi:hypothetical protein RclHR1_32450001 [Rhizophagus clarus]|uniref:Uncharacterized protein n=1 Tax=Rhizophagus clarus TaxID=94130 RepID=A0A2Z6RBW3_9GLOM|nr:hypothetical protein RclHR1_32450001 [Rhizophagus clarus]